MVEYSEPVAPVAPDMSTIYSSAITPSAINHSNGLTAIEQTQQTSNTCMTVAPVTTRTSSSLTCPENEGPCAECGEEIIDRFYLYALERRWHNSCLMCCVCRGQLESEGSCYVKDGLIFCKDDYFRRFGTQKCARCYNPIQSGEMVMRAHTNIYHVKCFTCIVCNSLLQTGDHFGIFDSHIYCRTDFEHLQYAANALVTDPTSSQCSNGRISTNISPGSIAMISNNCVVVTTSGPTPLCNVNGLTATSNLSPVNNYEELTFGDYPPPLSHPDFTTGQLEQHTTVTTKTQRGQQRKRRQHHTVNSQPWQIGLTVIDPDTGYHHTGGQSHQQVKQKRMRTSFKHHQLKIMKQYFTLNHNPDAKDLKQLSQKTGLSKRVLQVWFQNARAKYRRGQGEGGKDGNANDGEDNSPTEEENNSNDDMISDTESQDEQQSNTSIRSHTDDILSTSSPLNSLHTPESCLQAMISSPTSISQSETSSGVCI